MSARANVVFPAPRSPDSVMRSPGSSAPARSVAKRRVASSSGNVAVKLAPRGAVKSIFFPLLRRRQIGGFGKGKGTCDGGALSQGRTDRHLAAVQFHKRPDQRKPDAGAAIARAERMGFEPVEHFFLHVRRDAGAGIGNRERKGVGPAFGMQSNGRAGRGEIQGVRQKIEEDL